MQSRWACNQLAVREEKTSRLTPCSQHPCAAKFSMATMWSPPLHPHHACWTSSSQHLSPILSQYFINCFSPRGHATPLYQSMPQPLRPQPEWPSWAKTKPRASGRDGREGKGLFWWPHQNYDKTTEPSLKMPAVWLNRSPTAKDMQKEPPRDWQKEQRCGTG